MAIRAPCGADYGQLGQYGVYDKKVHWQLLLVDGGSSIFFINSSTLCLRNKWTMRTKSRQNTEL